MNSLKKIINTQIGFSLVSVLMATALAGGVALVVAQLGKNSSEVVKRASNSTAINELNNRVQKYLLNSRSCTRTLQEATSIGIGDTVEINDIYSVFEGAPEKIVLSKDQEVGKVRIHKIEFRRNDIVAVDMIITFDTDRRPGQDKLISKKFVLHGEFSGDTPLKCYSQLENAIGSAITKACEALDPGATITSSPSWRCLHSQAYIDNIIDQLSPAKKTPIYIDPATGAVSAKPITHRVNRTCSKCRKSGCTPPPCPSGYSRSGRSCSRGGLCGFKPRWRNCKVTCSKVIPSTGFVIKN